jgi:hypothetical protein
MVRPTITHQARSVLLADSTPECADREHTVAKTQQIRLRIRTQERRYVITDGAQELAHLLATHGRPIEYVVGRPETLITTIYFDTSNGTWSQGLSQTKLRARSYQNPDEWWFELKRREGSRVDKWRRPMSVETVLSTLSGPHRWKPVRTTVGTAPLLPVFGVQCRRTAFEWSGLRVTIDRDLTYFEVDPGAPLTLGRRRGHLDGVVIEVKQERDRPEWLETALDGREAKDFSKSRYGIALRDGSQRPFLIANAPEDLVSA